MPTLPTRALLAAVVSVVLIGSFAIAGPTAAATPNTSWKIHASVPVSRLANPWKVAIDATYYSFTDADTVSLAFSRQATTGNKPTQYQFWTAGGGTTAVNCVPTLDQCTENTHTDMRDYGQVNLTFAATGPATVKSHHCAANGNLLQQTTTRPGTLTGTVRLVTFNDYWGTVSNKGANHKLPSTFSATVTKNVNFDRSCPSGGGSGPCGNGLQVDGASLSIGQSFTAVRWFDGPARGHFSYRAQLYLGDGYVSQTFAIIASPPNNYMDAPQPGLGGGLAKDVIHFGAMAPFMSGTGTFEASTATAPDQNPACHAVHRDGQVSGKPVVKFDGYDSSTFEWFAYPGHSRIHRWHP